MEIGNEPRYRHIAYHGYRLYEEKSQASNKHVSELITDLKTTIKETRKLQQDAPEDNKRDVGAPPRRYSSAFHPTTRRDSCSVPSARIISSRLADVLACK